MPIADQPSPAHHGSYRGVTLRLLTQRDTAAVSNLLLEAADDDTALITGAPPGHDDEATISCLLPVDSTPGNKHVIGAFEGTRLRGIVEVNRGRPTPDTAHIDLLLISPGARGRGIARQLHDRVEELARAWSGITRLHGGIVAADAEHATGFWHSLGYRPNGTTAPYTAGTVSSITVYWERPLTVEAPSSMDAPRAPARPGLHHLELWTHDLSTTEPSIHWLLTALGWTAEHIGGWPLGRIWRHPSGPYFVLEQSDDVRGDRHDRRAPGLNHIAFTIADRYALDRLRSNAREQGWRELFGDLYPHAGGESHTAWYAENADGFEVEVVALRH